MHGPPSLNAGVLHRSPPGSRVPSTRSLAAHLEENINPSPGPSALLPSLSPVLRRPGQGDRLPCTVPAAGSAPVAVEPAPTLHEVCRRAVNRWFGRSQVTATMVWERTHASGPANRPCVGRQRGYVGIVPDDCRHAQSTTEVFRVLKLTLQMCGRRADHLRNIEAVARALLSLTDYQSLLTRPGHETILDRVPISRRTLQRAIDTLHQLGLLITVEEGTTPWLRRARIRRGQNATDPAQGNRAEVYQWIVPRWADGFLTCEDANVTPSRTSPKERTGRTCPSSRRETTGSYKRREYLRRKLQVTRRRPPRRLWSEPSREVRMVWETAMPTDLTSRLEWHEAERLADEIARQLLHRTPEELAGRLQRHWRYWQFKLAADRVRSAVAVAFRMLRRDFDDCPDVRCEDGWHLDRDQPCQHCTMVAQDVIASRRTPAAPVTSEAPADSPHLGRAEPSTILGAPGAISGVPFHRPNPLPPQRVAQHAARARAMLTAALQAGPARDRSETSPVGTPHRTRRKPLPRLA